MSTPGPAAQRPSSHRRRASRKVRLRRTLAGTIALVLVGSIAYRQLTKDDPAPVQAVKASASAPSTTRATAKPSTTTTSSEDGSPSTETTAPDAKSVPQHGTGAITVVPVPAVKPATSGRTVRYTVEIEGGLGVDPTTVAATIQSVLLDSRGWQKVDGIRFVNVTPAEAKQGAHVDIRVTLASPGLTDKLCAPMQTLSQVSCWNGERSVLNLRRWVLGDDSYGTDVARYREYQVNHEVGHGLGHQHRSCPAKGDRAPVMVQQTLSLQGCTPWPYPSGA
ncbi:MULTISPECIES: DUF3152 domain-containing protein [unclassified Phycicoccus]|uniref:DUF3152 domain-containing protein n=1 Tax=unclassified Phycicoccus TaxID=2637926 RepID=UPI000703A9D3|nr:MULTISPECIES: DUF3152 domain-containing protein [unclassified Phycicoccus]KQU70577.1 hypothetical protein ASC58_01905 [Phycicoccus sp. Root101]KQZ88870.1 hypothetical protein ASD62_05695 [Phycicoccus sp. Root563]